MALLKAVKTNYGIDAAYWNIGAINTDFKNKTIEVVMFGYLSQDNKNSNAEPVAWKNITLSDDDYIADATRLILYPILKTKYFIDAKDC